MSNSSMPAGKRGLFASWLAGVMAVVLLFGLLLSTVHFYAVFKPFYDYEYIKYDNARVIGVDSEVLSGITSVLIDYIQGKNVDLHIDANIGGELSQVFSEKEIAHMEDVRKLFGMLRVALAASAGGVLLLFGASFASAPKGRRACSICRGVFWVTLAALLGFLALALYIALDFSNAFMLFHKLFFAGDTEVKWLLDPSTDVLIQMVPEGFFIDIGIAIGSTFLGLIVLTIAVSAALLSRTKGARARTHSTQTREPAFDDESGRQILQALAYRPADVPVKSEPLLFGGAGKAAAPPAHRPENKAATAPEQPKAAPASDTERFTPVRPNAEEIFQEMGIYDDSAVPETIKQLIRKTAQPLEPKPIHASEIKHREITPVQPRSAAQEDQAERAIPVPQPPQPDKGDTPAEEAFSEQIKPDGGADLGNRPKKERLDPSYEDLMNRLKRL